MKTPIHPLDDLTAAEMTAAASTTTNNGNTNILIRALYICVCR